MIPNEKAIASGDSMEQKINFKPTLQQKLEYYQRTDTYFLDLEEATAERFNKVSDESGEGSFQMGYFMSDTFVGENRG